MIWWNVSTFLSSELIYKEQKNIWGNFDISGSTFLQSGSFKAKKTEQCSKIVLEGDWKSLQSELFTAKKAEQNGKTVREDASWFLWEWVPVVKKTKWFEETFSTGLSPRQNWGWNIEERAAKQSN